ncbi:MAG: ABC transporter permease [Eubacterium sp.]|nr:ABC transporter permease [Eubacterium sp.]
MEENTKKKSVLKTIVAAREFTLLLIIVAFCIFLAISKPAFGTWLNIKTLLVSMSTTGMAVLAMTFVMISGGIDLSVGSLMCLTMGVSSLLFRGGMNPWIASIIGIIVGAGIGLLQGLIITKLKLIHFIVTMCFMGIARGIVMWITGGTPISLVGPLAEAPAFSKMGQGDVLNGTIPLPIIIFIVIVIAADIILRRSAKARQVLYTGSNEKAAEYSGINTDKVKIAVMVLSGIFCGIGGIIYMVRFSGVPVNAGTGYEMTAIAACVIGGCSMNGGRGTVFGAILGLAFMTLITNAMNLFMVTPTIQDVIRYLVVLLAVILDSVQMSMRQKKVS